MRRAMHTRQGFAGSVSLPDEQRLKGWKRRGRRITAGGCTLRRATGRRRSLADGRRL
jgi:hypothetical protein